MLKIRLQRVGRTNIPTFRVVLTDSKNSTKSGRYLEVLGFYNPAQKTKKVEGERIQYWLSKGAQATGTVHNLLVDEKVISGPKINVLRYKHPIKKEETEKSAVSAANSGDKAEVVVAPVEAKAETKPGKEEKSVAAKEEVKA